MPRPPAPSVSAPTTRASSMLVPGPLDPAPFQALAGRIAPRDIQDLMAHPFFSLAKSPRSVPIRHTTGAGTILVEAMPGHGMATIWDADVLIWATSQIVEARDRGLPTSPRMAATPHEILRFVGRGTSARDYARLRDALDRLQATSVLTTLRLPPGGHGLSAAPWQAPRLAPILTPALTVAATPPGQHPTRLRHRFSWLSAWVERADAAGRPLGIELVLPDWIYTRIGNDAAVLTIDRRYFGLTGGLERWLYRLVRKHGGTQGAGWGFDVSHLHAKSGSLSQAKRFAHELRLIVWRQPLPGYRLWLEHSPSGAEWLGFTADLAGSPPGRGGPQPRPEPVDNSVDNRG